MQCNDCARPRYLGEMCAIGVRDNEEPCEQKITEAELNRADFCEICAWCGAKCCYCGVMCRYMISDLTLVAYGISTELKVPCAALDPKEGCRLPRECRPKPCLVYVCELARFLLDNPEAWDYCKTHGRVTRQNKIVCKDCPNWSKCTYEKRRRSRAKR